MTDRPERLDRPRPNPVTILGRDEAHREAILPRVDKDLERAIRRDVAAPPPLLLLPLRLEYRVVERNVPIRLAANVASMFDNAHDVRVEGRVDPRRAAAARELRRRVDPDPRERLREWSLNPTRVTLTSRREIWFRWYPDEDFSLHGVAPITPAETDALARFDETKGSANWYDLDLSLIHI